MRFIIRRWIISIIPCNVTILITETKSIIDTFKLKVFIIFCLAVYIYWLFHFIYPLSSHTEVNVASLIIYTALLQFISMLKVLMLNGPKLSSLSTVHLHIQYEIAD